MNLLLIRTYYAEGTNGTLSVDNHKHICYTIELPWINNQPRTSCIPEGVYEIRMRYSLKYKTHMIIRDVCNRSLILIHPANNALLELKGCIAPVTKHTGHGKGSQSRIAFDKLKKIISISLEEAPVFITIKS